VFVQVGVADSEEKAAVVWSQEGVAVDKFGRGGGTTEEVWPPYVTIVPDLSSLFYLISAF